MHPNKLIIRALGLGTAILVVLASPGLVAAGTTERASIRSDGQEANGGSFAPTVSADGRFVAFVSNASNLVEGDTNGVCDVFVRDRVTGLTERVSVSSGGVQGNHDSGRWVIQTVTEPNIVFVPPSLSADGRYVAFQSGATNLVSPATSANGQNIFVRDRLAGTTELVNVPWSARHLAGDCFFPSISSDGSCVAYASDTTYQVPGDTNDASDIFVRDRAAGTVERVSVGPDGQQANGGSTLPTFSANGQYIAFSSGANNLVPGDTNAMSDIFLRDRLAGTTARVSLGDNGGQPNAPCIHHSLSADGRYIAFQTYATNLIPGVPQGGWNVFIRDRLLETTESAAVGICGAFYGPNRSLSTNGRYIVFGKGYGRAASAYVRDRVLGATQNVTVSSEGVEAVFGPDDTMFASPSSFGPAMSADARYVAFSNCATNLVAGDTNNAADVFVRDRGALYGDADADGDVDIADFDIFRACFNGQNRPAQGTNCGDVDFDADNDVDLRDFAVFRSCFNGTNQLPACH